MDQAINRIAAPDGASNTLVTVGIVLALSAIVGLAASNRNSDPDPTYDQRLREANESSSAMLNRMLRPRCTNIYDASQYYIVGGC